MKTDLAYIQETANAAVSNYRNQAIQLKVAGFNITKPAAIDENYNRERANFKTVAEQVKTKLESMGVTPLAILPASWWNKIVDDTGLYDFKPNSEGFVEIDVESEANLIHQGRILWGYHLGAGVLGALIWTVIFISKLSTTDLVFGGTLTAMVSAFAAFGFMMICTRKFAGLMAKIYVMNVGSKNVWRRMLNVRSSHYNQHVRVTLPQAPADVSDILLKLQSVSSYLRVAAEPGAVAFSKSASSVIGEKLGQRAADHRAENMRAIRNAFADPIIYYKYESVVAIVAQFGDFPIEKDIVDKVIANNTL